MIIDAWKDAKGRHNYSKINKLIVICNMKLFKKRHDFFNDMKKNPKDIITLEEVINGKHGRYNYH